ncbi:MAG: biotin--[Rikenellaceae bacterium]|nr:biotin--[acetyl-CoA-carboxylase] ligase [Rikenellaceae bacterium]
MIYRFDTLSSTNDEARNPRYTHGDVVVAEFQTEGRGQRGNRWSSASGQNLMLSVVLCPENLAAADQFSLLECVALALTDTFAAYNLPTTIKWTNDIYVGDRKLVGVLIENSLADGRVARSVVGVGININQTEFDPSLPNPTSMAVECGREVERTEVLERFVGCLMQRYASLAEGRESLHAEYVARMYRRGVEADFVLPDGTKLRGTIRDVAPRGDLVVDTSEGVRTFLFKQIAFVI